MVQRVFQQVLRFFATIATALAGLGAVCTAAGFLAERTRWSMLGFGATPADLNEYLFTGARFLAFLPGIALTSTLTAAIASVTAFLLAAAAFAAFLVLRRLAPLRRLRARARVGRWAHRMRPGALVALAVFQFAGTFVLFQAGSLRNVLFTDRSTLAGECGQARLGLEAEVLLGCEEELVEHMGHVFLIVLVSGGAFWLLVGRPERGRGEEQGAAVGGDLEEAAARENRPNSRFPMALGAVNLTLLAIQVILLPINYGALFLRNEFSVVELTLTRPELREDRWPADGRFSLLHRRDDEFYLYAASARRIWLIPRAEIETLVYLGICGVFEPDDGCRSGPPSHHSLQESP